VPPRRRSGYCLVRGGPLPNGTRTHMGRRKLYPALKRHVLPATVGLAIILPYV
jgi:hypothetical protein